MKSASKTPSKTQLKTPTKKNVSICKTPIATSSSSEFHGNNPVSQAKYDLMQLGIELDDELIMRLKQNLGADRIFSVAHNVAQYIKPTKSNSTTVPEMIYRNVSDETKGQSDLEYLNNNASGKKRLPTSNVLPFQLDMIESNDSSQHSSDILRKLHDVESDIEPQYRPLLFQIIEYFRIQYGRSPLRFISHMLGRKLSKEEKKNQNNSNQTITRWILQCRYVNRTEFTTMIHRLVPSLKPDLIEALFQLLCEKKKFNASNNTQRRVLIIVDLWSFLLLLKTANEESRRSYDEKKSFLATNVEFWKNQCNITNFEECDSTGGKIEDNFIIPHKTDSKEKVSERKALIRKSNVPSSVAESLGCEKHIHQNQINKGKNILGKIQNEVFGSCDVPSALNSDIKNRPPSPNRQSRLKDFANNLPLPSSPNLYDSRSVAFLLGQDTKPPSKESNGKRTNYYNFLEKEQFNRTSVSYALGNINPPPPPEESKPKSFALRSWVEKNPSSYETTNRKLSLSSKNNLYWDRTTKASVAAALSGNS